MPEIHGAQNLPPPSFPLVLSPGTPSILCYLTLRLAATGAPNETHGLSWSPVTSSARRALLVCATRHGRGGNVRACEGGQQVEMRHASGVEWFCRVRFCFERYRRATPCSPESAARQCRDGGAVRRWSVWKRRSIHGLLHVKVLISPPPVAGVIFRVLQAQCAQCRCPVPVCCLLRPAHGESDGPPARRGLPSRCPRCCWLRHCAR